VSDPVFAVEVDENQYVPEGSSVVDAVLTVSAGTVVTAGAGGASRAAARAGTSAAQVVVIDCSGSMANPSTKISEARKATMTAIDTLRDGVPFAVVAGRHTATLVYPRSHKMVPATTRTRAEAKAAVKRLEPDGGTAIGSWLTLARMLLTSEEAEVKHTILLTDGKNEHETPARFAAAVEACKGRFVCDCRGIGDGWIADELMAIASALLGTADGLEDPTHLPAAFQAMTGAVMAKSIGDVAMRVWTPAGGRVRFVKQVYPQVLDLTDRRVDLSPRVGAYPTGAWGTESRDYHVSIELPSREVGEEMLAARISFVEGAAAEARTDGEVLAQGLVLATWTDDTELSTEINPRVAHYTGQAELASAIQEGLAAREAGDAEAATERLGRAVQLAAQSGHGDTAKLLARVVDVVDEESGTVRLRRRVAEIDSELAKVRSVKTTRVRKS
jgi:hypothetical protein